MGKYIRNALCCNLLNNPSVGWIIFCFRYIAIYNSIHGQQGGSLLVQLLENVKVNAGVAKEDDGIINFNPKWYLIGAHLVDVKLKMVFPNTGLPVLGSLDNPGTITELCTPADEHSIPGQWEKTCSAVGLRSRFWVHTNRSRIRAQSKR